MLKKVVRRSMRLFFLILYRRYRGMVEELGRACAERMSEVVWVQLGDVGYYDEKWYLGECISDVYVIGWGRCGYRDVVSY